MMRERSNYNQAGVCTCIRMGVLEAKDVSREFFGETRLQETLEGSQQSSLQMSVDSTVKAVLDWTGNDQAQDDLSILSFEWAP